MHDQKASSSWYTIKISSLVLLTFAVAFFPRVFAAVGVPSVIDFLHFLFVPILCVLTLSRTQTKVWNYISKEIFFCLFVLLVLMFASALLNGAGVLNVILDFCLLGEPFVLLLAITSRPMSEASIKQFRFWMMLFIFIHLFFVYFQSFILKIQNQDDIKGIFIKQGGGHNVGGAVALTTAVYFFVVFKKIPIWIRTLVSVAFAANVVLADTKQVVLVFLISLVVLVFTKLNNFKEILQYLTITIVFFVFLNWVIPIFYPGMFTYWTPIKIVAALEEKFSVFSIIESYYNSPLNWLFGLGPGHTIGRLAELTPHYIDYLQPLGITSTPITHAIVTANDTGQYTNKYTGTSLFALTFSWAGVWGDLGFLGLGIYLYLWFLVWRKLCLDNLSKFFLINPLVFSTIFSWMEEPGYILLGASLIGVQWQAHQIKQKVILPKSSIKKHLWEIT